MGDVRDARIAQLLTDPDVGGDLLLIGVALIIAVDGDDAVFAGKDGGLTLEDLADHLWPKLSRRLRTQRIHSAMRGDIRTYRPPTDLRCCTAPRTCRDGVCGQRAMFTGHVTNWATGEQSQVLACNQHRVWFTEVLEQNRAATPANPPLPYANHGGTLRRHLPELQWPYLWRRLDPRWVELPEKPVDAAPPTFHLITGGGQGSTATDRSVRPPLTLLPQSAS
jgi:hypothetical protein